ncbi:hypothetical protein B0H19DRAFT_1210978 [Mycena capillaripes]|nr:hypothetical protein B0H19DRAFT_1210978 [Mycena capillaripes]
MKLALFFATLLHLTFAFAPLPSGNYYLHALPQAERLAILDGMQAAGMKVLRTWVGGLHAGQKASTNIAVPDLEANGIGSYDDTVLNLIDQLMVDSHARVCHNRDLFSYVAIHLHCQLRPTQYHCASENSLQDGDVYASKYDAINAFYQRIIHILNNHNNALLGNQSWSELSGYIFGTRAAKRSFYTSHLSWICDAAQQIRKNVGDRVSPIHREPITQWILLTSKRNQLIFTGGGSAGASVQSTFFGSSCSAIDVVAIHDYTEAYDNYMPSAISQAQVAGKKLVVEEWGSLVGLDRAANLNSNVDKINNYKVPFLYWELISNADPHQNEDYEIQVNGANWSTILATSQMTGALSGAPLDFTEELTL